MPKLERDYQPKVIQRLLKEFPGCVVLKNDSSYMQGIPDLTVLYFSWWAVLEVKRHAKAKRQPNQPYYIAELNKMSCAHFIHPENEEEVFRDLQRSYQASRDARDPVG